VQVSRQKVFAENQLFLLVLDVRVLVLLLSMEQTEPLSSAMLLPPDIIKMHN